ncbi:hypothetical protein N7508_001068 [Penicillium antarcticum]|uniref:uncharacterized protein n=1 Tax=Penicillium antarcticum TaxID=416450 RepID=UPI00238D9016|nr:uncharacterized protein N7508_001068 [Penicillium antarcticum]KAJ5316560.1 hypothetical protein N7508_001068 [Penicillium antarcticum]
MATKARPAFVEDYDEESHATRPNTRMTANATANSAAKIARSDLFPEPLIDGASDSGYSSRTAATANSTQSGPSGGQSPPLRESKRGDLTRKSSTRRERKEERVRPTRDETMVGAYSGAHHAHVPRSSSKSRRREASHAHYYNDPYYDPPQTHYQSDRRPVEAPFYIPQRPPVPEYPQQSARYPAGVIENIHVNHPSRPSRSHTYHTYHSNGRPMSFHGMPPAMGSGMASPIYSQAPIHAYDYHGGPPPSGSAYMHNQYSSSPYGGSFYAPSEYAPPSEYRERSESRPRESRPRRSSSIYGHPPPVDSGAYSPWYDDEPMERPLERYTSREAYGRAAAAHRQDPDEDFYRMPPPPPPPMPNPKAKAPPQIHQARRPEARKSQTTTAVPSQRRPSRGMDRGIDRSLDRFDMGDLEAELPVVSDRSHRRISREAALPERANSLRSSHRRSTSYQDDRRGAQVAVASSRRRQPTYYYNDEPPSNASDNLEDREREIENYQAARSGRNSTASVPLSAEAILPKATTNRHGSESGSQKSRSNSSRGSGTGSKTEEDKNMTLMVNGVKMEFNQETIAGQSINIRAGEARNALRLNIAGGPRSKQYLTGSNSDYTGGSSRRDPDESMRRNRGEARSERALRRSSQSTYGSTRYH